MRLADRQHNKEQVSRVEAKKMIPKLGISPSTAETCRLLLGMFIFLSFVSVCLTVGWNPARITAIQTVLCGKSNVEVSYNKKSSQILA
jgi:hypothetical protein